MKGNRRSGMSRRRFLGTAAAGVGAAAMGLGGAGAGVAVGRSHTSRRLAITSDKVTERPAEDWLKNNWHSTNFTTPHSILPHGYYAAIHYDPVAPCGGYYSDEEPDCTSTETSEYDIKVFERKLAPGMGAEVTVQVHANNAPLTVYRLVDGIIGLYGPYFQLYEGYEGCNPDYFHCLPLEEPPWVWCYTNPPPEPILGSGADGHIDYFFMAKFIIPEPGAEIPPILSSEDVQIIFINIQGTGYGYLTNHSGETGYSTGIPYSVFGACFPFINPVEDDPFPSWPFSLASFQPQVFTPEKRARVTITGVGPFLAAWRSGFKGALIDGYPVENIMIQEL